MSGPRGFSAFHSNARVQDLTGLFVLCPGTGHGPTPHLVEGWSRAGVSGHHPGDVDPPEGVAALRGAYAPREGRLRLVTPPSGLYWSWGAQRPTASTAGHTGPTLTSNITVLELWACQVI